MTEKFIPIKTDRAEMLEKESTDYEQGPANDTIRILAWADSREELELMEKMSDDELEAYLDRKRGSR